MAKSLCWMLLSVFAVGATLFAADSNGIEVIAEAESESIYGAACGGHAHVCPVCTTECAGAIWQYWCPAGNPDYVHGSGDKKVVTDVCRTGGLACGSRDYIRFCDNDETPLAPPGGWPVHE